MIFYLENATLKKYIKVANAHLGKMSGYMNNKIIISKPGNDDPNNVVFYDLYSCIKLFPERKNNRTATVALIGLSNSTNVGNSLENDNKMKSIIKI